MKLTGVPSTAVLLHLIHFRNRFMHVSEPNFVILIALTCMTVQCIDLLFWCRDQEANPDQQYHVSVVYLFVCGLPLTCEYVHACRVRLQKRRVQEHTTQGTR